MWLTCIVVMSTVSLSLAQSDANCNCVPYFLCKVNFTESDQCLYNEVCCGTKINPSNPGGISICGERGKRKIDTTGDLVGWKVWDKFDNTKTTFGEFPWMVAIFKVDSSGEQKFLCGGSVIFPNIILTTAHTISGLSALDLRVKAGVWNTTDILESDKHQDRTVSATVIHSGFDKDKVQDDVALLVLTDPLEMTDNVKTICLPSADTVFNSTDCIATGWGENKLGNNGIGSVLRMVHLPLVDFDTCQEEFLKVPRLREKGFKLHNSFICAGGENADTCTGDGGGPLICPLLDGSSKYVQVGIVSWGIECGVMGRPGAYSSVVAARNWIDTMADAFPATSPRVSTKL